MAVSADVIPRRPTLLFIVVLSLLFILMSLSSRTRFIGETRTLFERTVMTIFSPVPKAGELDRQHDVRHVPRLPRHAPRREREPRAAPQGRVADDREPQAAPVGHRHAPPAQPPRLLRAVQRCRPRWRRRSCSTRPAASNRSSSTAARPTASRSTTPVVNANGLIGRVVLTTKDMAKVQLITDSNSLGRRAHRADAPAGRSSRRRRCRAGAERHPFAG